MLHNDLTLSPQIMKIHKIVKLVANLHDKNEYHILDLIKTCFKPYIHRNTMLRNKAKKEKKILKSIFFNLVFCETMENVRKHTDAILVATKKINYLVSELNYQKKNFFGKFYLDSYQY